MSLTLEVVRPSSLTDDKNIHQLVVIALYGKGKWNQVLLFRESGKVLAGLDSLFFGHFGSNDC